MVTYDEYKLDNPFHNEKEPDTYNFVSEPQLIELKGIDMTITDIKNMLESELAHDLFNIKTDCKGLKDGVYITISGWFETYDTQYSYTSMLEDKINNVIYKIEN
jgi:hypothetical protein